MRKVLLLFILSISLTFCISCTGFVNTNTNDDSTETYANIELLVSCKEIIDNLGSENYSIVPEKEIILPDSGVIFRIKDKFDTRMSLLEILLSQLREYRIHFDNSDGYLKAISNIYEGDCGEFSGWMFFVNGVLSEVAADDYTVREGDVIEFKYVVDYTTLFE